MRRTPGPAPSSSRAPPSRKVAASTPALPTIQMTAPVGDNVDDDAAMSDEKRFYYLRLMAKPHRGKNEPIVTKFVTWTEEDNAERNRKVRADNPELESQAMRVVRTIGQAFEVCHKVAKEQMSEKAEEDFKARGSVISEEDVADIEREEEEEKSRTESPVEVPPQGKKKMSLFQPRKFSSDRSSLGTTIEALQNAPSSSTGTGHPAISALLASTVQPIVPALVDANPVSAQTLTSTTVNSPAKLYAQALPATSVAPAELLPTTHRTSGAGMPSSYSHHDRLAAMPGPSTSTATLPHSHTMPTTAAAGGLPQQAATLPSSLQSIDHPAHYGMYTPLSFVMPTGSLPFRLASPVSPYATLPLGPTIPPPTSADDPTLSPTAAHQLRSLEHYSQTLIRSQLEQAQQTAQVAGCQVQLLRDQLSSETTARIEAQSRTHQLLNANRELLEQVQSLVARMQTLETKLNVDIHNALPDQQVPSTSTAPKQANPYYASQAAGPSYSKALPPTGKMSLQDEMVREKQRSSPKRRMPATMNMSYHESFVDQPSSSTATAAPYQQQTLADLRSGSLPPSSDHVDREANRRKTTDDGARTEPESNAEDTTDYSSSDQYEKMREGEPFLNVLMSNPSALSCPSEDERDRALSQLQAQLQLQQQGQRAGSPRKQGNAKKAGILKEKDFVRMSFNTRLNKDEEEMGKRAENESPKSQRRGTIDIRPGLAPYESLFKPAALRDVDSIPERRSPEQPPPKRERSPEKSKFDMFGGGGGVGLPGFGMSPLLRRPGSLSREPFADGEKLPAASTSVATAMYPPTRMSQKPLQSHATSAQPKVEIFTRRQLGGLSDSSSGTASPPKASISVVPSLHTAAPSLNPHHAQNNNSAFASVAPQGSTINNNNIVRQHPSEFVKHDDTSNSNRPLDGLLSNAVNRQLSRGNESGRMMGNGGTNIF